MRCSSTPNDAEEKNCSIVSSSLVDSIDGLFANDPEEDAYEYVEDPIEPVEDFSSSILSHSLVNTSDDPFVDHSPEDATDNRRSCRGYG